MDDAELDRLLTHAPALKPGSTVDASALTVLRSGQLPATEEYILWQALGLDDDARGLFAYLDTAPNERQLRRAVDAGIHGPNRDPVPRSWPWAFGGAALALLIVLSLVYGDL